MYFFCFISNVTFRTALDLAEEGSTVQMEFISQMDGGPMDRICYVDLDRPKWRRSNGPPILRPFGPSKGRAVQWTTYLTLIWTDQIKVTKMVRLQAKFKTSLQ